MASYIGRNFSPYKYSYRILRKVRCKKMYFCTKPEDNFTTVRLSNRGHIKVVGEDSVRFLQNLVTNDVNLFHCDNLMNSLYTMMLSTKGRVLYDFILYKQENEAKEFLIECDIDAVDGILNTFKPYKLRSKVTFDDVSEDYNSWAVIEEDSVTGLKRTKNDSKGVILAKDPRVLSLGSRLVLANGRCPTEYFSNVKATNDQNVYDNHRVSLGICEGIKDIEPGVPLPLEFNIAELHGVSFQKGCYIGQELTARSYHTGVIRKRLLPIKILPTSREERLDFDRGAVILTNEGKRAGKLISVYGAIGLGLIRLQALKAGDILSIAVSDERAVNITVDQPAWLNLS
ncbi:putative transferase CAF17 homolog, mitochondrial [Dendronephthya gigantea]|uniref:putative transferase CAF17 homolog, mitochondrial n=1 Tax=Dendronephthya gigantea TaxID=151771 RepID=UPI001069B13E|nr:putative transferase CAF17 homolog, mitochondrial [Dendronephthya gigantea]